MQLEAMARRSSPPCSPAHLYLLSSLCLPVLSEYFRFLGDFKKFSKDGILVFEFKVRGAARCMHARRARLRSFVQLTERPVALFVRWCCVVPCSPAGRHLGRREDVQGPRGDRLHSHHGVHQEDRGLHLQTARAQHLQAAQVSPATSARRHVHRLQQPLSRIVSRAGQGHGSSCVRPCRPTSPAAQPITDRPVPQPPGCCLSVPLPRVPASVTKCFYSPFIFPLSLFTLRFPSFLSILFLFVLHHPFSPQSPSQPARRTLFPQLRSFLSSLSSSAFHTILFNVLPHPIGRTSSFYCFPFI